MADADPAPAAQPAPPIVSPTVAEILAAHGTIRRGAFGRFYAPRGLDSVDGPLVMAAIADGSAFVSQRAADGSPFAITATAARMVTAETAGTAEAGTEATA